MDCYDVPEAIADGQRSDAFRKFLWNWFADPGALTHGELDLSFLQQLSAEELATARELIRRNLKLGYNHIVEAAAALRDVEAVPILRRMLDREGNASRQLVIAGALWNLVRDPVFVTCLEAAKGVRGSLLTGAHLYQVLWLDDERAIDFLIDLLDHRDRIVRIGALGMLNRLELGVPGKILYNPDHYRECRRDESFRGKMVEAVRRLNRQMTNGMAFGFIGYGTNSGTGSSAT